SSSCSPAGSDARPGFRGPGGIARRGLRVYGGAPGAVRAQSPCTHPPRVSHTRRPSRPSRRCSARMIADTSIGRTPASLAATGSTRLLQGTADLHHSVRTHVKGMDGMHLLRLGSRGAAVAEVRTILTGLG